METGPLISPADYHRALTEVGKLMHAKAGSPEGERLDVLVTLIEMYEAKHYPMDDPSRSP